ncbi:MAG TPA: hypothetical protein VM052_07995 [Candidatus Limnocylindrales bacterium]|nr:hypothetical protein [Candidatus Limnocylindrales bacterium]
MYTRGERLAQASLVAIALVFAIAVGGFLFGRAGGGASASGSPTPSASAAAKAPEVALVQDTCCTQAARFMKVSWTSSEKVSFAKAALVPDPGFACGTTVDPSGLKGLMSCSGLLTGATEYVATLTLVTARGTYTYPQKFKTMGNRLTAVPWYTEFEDPKGDPLACAAASVRIVQSFTSGKEPITAAEILKQGQALNKSRDPGIDPVAIASMQKKLDARNNYHYYRFTTREEATKSAIYWLVRSGKPVHVISLAGQHDPLLVGFTGTFGTFYDDPANAFTQVIVEDAQRGDVRPETANHRPDKSRSTGFQTGQALNLDEWYRDEWWLGFAYLSPIRMPDGSLLAVDRNDGAYPAPHWAGRFVILADDGDADWPSDKEGRVVWH